MERIQKALGLTIVALSLTACSIAGSNQSQIQTNRHIYGIDCSGSASSMSVCYKKAKTICPNGFNVISKQESLPLPMGNTLLTEPSTGNPAANIGEKRNINIECS